MRFGQMVIVINLLMDHQASGAPAMVTSEIGNHAIPNRVSSQTAFKPSGMGLQVAHGNPEKKYMRSVFQQTYGVDPETASHRQLEDATHPKAPFYFSNPRPPGINPNEISPNTKITEQIGVAWQDLGQPYMAPEPAYAPQINPKKISPNTKINPQIGVAWQDLDPNYFGSGTSISPGINPEVHIHTNLPYNQGSHHQVLSNLTGVQWAGVGIGSVSAAAVISVIGRLPWRAYLKYGRKDDIPIIPPEVTKIWSFLKSKMQRPTPPKSKTPVLEIVIAEHKIPTQKVDKSPVDTIGNMEGQVQV